MPDEMKREDVEVRTPEKIEAVVSPNHVRFYANNVELSASVWDFCFLFGEIVKIEGKGAKLTIERRASITMSPQHAKAFSDILDGHIKKYESKFGEIPKPISPAKQE